MSTALMSPFYEVGDLFQNFRNNQLKSQPANTTDRRIVGSSSLSTRNRNFSTGSSSAFVPVTSRGSSQSNLVSGSNMLISQTDSLGCGITSVAPREHKKLDRSMSEPVGSRQTQGANINSSRYKTEMCRPFEESGHCKYGDKCQFAHGIHELRNLARHPKYKTELCRTFHTIGFCPYGPRCHFIHNEDERKLNQLVNKNQHANSVLQPGPLPQQQAPIERPKSIKFNSLGSSFDSQPSSSTGSPTNLSPTFSGDIFSYSAFQSSSSSTSSRSSSDSCRSSPVFSSYSPVADILDSTAHLNVQAPLNINVNVNSSSTDFSQFNSVLKLNNQKNDNQQSVFDDIDLLQLCSNFTDTLCTGDVFSAPPPSSPESISGESVGSSTASTGSSSYGTTSLDVGQALRLPFFNQLNIDSN